MKFMEDLEGARGEKSAWRKILCDFLSFYWNTISSLRNGRHKVGEAS